MGATPRCCVLFGNFPHEKKCNSYLKNFFVATKRTLKKIKARSKSLSLDTFSMKPCIFTAGCSQCIIGSTCLNCTHADHTHAVCCAIKWQTITNWAGLPWTVTSTKWSVGIKILVKGTSFLTTSKMEHFPRNRRNNIYIYIYIYTQTQTYKMAAVIYFKNYFLWLLKINSCV